MWSYWISGTILRSSKDMYLRASKLHSTTIYVQIKKQVTQDLKRVWYKYTSPYKAGLTWLP